jgi:hypothetical protein
MKQCKLNRGLFYRPGNYTELPATILLKVDDSFGVGDGIFLNDEETKSKTFNHTSKSASCRDRRQVQWRACESKSYLAIRFKTAV